MARMHQHDSIEYHQKLRRRNAVFRNHAIYMTLIVKIWFRFNELYRLISEVRTFKSTSQYVTLRIFKQTTLNPYH
jgi:hypothetical protein